MGWFLWIAFSHERSCMANSKRQRITLFGFSNILAGGFMATQPDKAVIHINPRYWKKSLPNPAAQQHCIRSRTRVGHGPAARAASIHPSWPRIADSFNRIHTGKHSACHWWCGWVDSVVESCHQEASGCLESPWGFYPWSQCLGRSKIDHVSGDSPSVDLVSTYLPSLNLGYLFLEYIQIPELFQSK